MPMPYKLGSSLNRLDLFFLVADSALAAGSGLSLELVSRGFPARAQG